MTSVYKSRPGQIDFNAYRSGPNGAIMMTPELEAKLGGTDAAINAETASKIKNQRRMENIFKAASIGIVGGAGVAGAMGAGAGAGAAASGGGTLANVVGSTSGAYTGGMAGFGTAAGAGATTAARLGSIFSSPGFEVGANTGLALLGMRQSNKANSQARTDALANQAKMIELEQQRLAAELQNANLDREDARRLNDAIQALEGKKFALIQESAQFERGIVEREQGSKDRYRSSIQEPAAARLRSILGLG